MSGRKVERKRYTNEQRDQGLRHGTSLYPNRAQASSDGRPAASPRAAPLSGTSFVLYLLQPELRGPLNEKKFVSDSNCVCRICWLSHGPSYHRGQIGDREISTARL